MSTNKFSSRVHYLLSLCFIKPHLYWGRWAWAYLNPCSWTITTQFSILVIQQVEIKSKSTIYSPTLVPEYFSCIWCKVIWSHPCYQVSEKISSPPPQSHWPSASDFIEQYLLLSGDWWGRCSHFPQSCWWPWPEQSMYC